MNYLEIIGTIVGFVYLILEYKASYYLWIAGIIMPAIYIFVYYDAGLYADFAINIYYLLIAVYGYILWTKGNWKKRKNIIKYDDRTEEGKELKITHTPKKNYYIYTALFITSFIIIGFVLEKFTDSNVPWYDSFTTALSIVGMIMLAKKYLEQWIAWIAVDAVCFGLYIYKGLFFTAVLYGVYAIIAIFGYYKWLKIMDDDAIE